MSYEVQGKLVAIMETVQRTETFRIREFVIEKTDDIGGRSITNYIKFQCVQDKTSLPDRFSLGEEVKVYFNLKGSKRTKDGIDSYYTNLDAWRMEQIRLGGSTEQAPPDFTPDQTPSDNLDDLPF